jgi:fructoselysine-6-P-deglycase FrlB-like protein
MTDMIAAEPHLARRLLTRVLEPGSTAHDLAALVREVATRGEPILVTGCGTSEHGSIGVADILRDALRAGGITDRLGSVLAAEAFEASLSPERAGLVIGVTHEGGTAATNAALAAARAAGTRTAVITAGAASPAGRTGEIVVATEEMDQSWCHTIGYVSPLLVGAAVGALVSEHPIDPDAIGRLMEAGSSDTDAAAAIAARLAGATGIIVTGSGSDRPAARELVLKIEEAAWLPSAMRDLETLLHGHLPATDESTGLVLIVTDRERRSERVARARQALAAARVLGVRTGAILSEAASDGLSSELTPAGRLVVPDAPDMPAPVAALLGSATALQLLTERIARARGTNPDPIRRDDARYAEAAAISGT